MKKPTPKSGVAMIRAILNMTEGELAYDMNIPIERVIELEKKGTVPTDAEDRALHSLARRYDQFTKRYGPPTQCHRCPNNSKNN